MGQLSRKAWNCAGPSTRAVDMPSPAAAFSANAAAPIIFCKRYMHVVFLIVVAFSNFDPTVV